MIKRIRNRGSLPFLATEGVIVKPLQVQKSPIKGGCWYKGLTPFQRMHSHHTLASVRRYAYFKPISGLIPRDELDILLASPYNHSEEVFQDRVDVCIQAETLGINTWRRLRNTRDLKRERLEKGAIDASEKQDVYNYAHPVLIGGISERRHASNIKLMNSSHHSPQTNAGYTRQDRDGTRYQY